MSTMQKQYAGNAPLAFNTVLAGGDPAGQGQAPANRALASVEITTAQADSAVAGALNLTGGAFVFEPGWTSPAVDLSALNGGFSASDLTGPAVAEFASLLGSTSDGASVTDSGVPIWGLTSDDFSFI